LVKTYSLPGSFGDGSGADTGCVGENADDAAAGGDAGGNDTGGFGLYLVLSSCGRGETADVVGEV
jgi:hypothetical protein